jgi:hypothetical protein
MSGIKISDLPAASAALGAMQFEVNDAGTSRRVTAEQVKAYAAPLATQAEAQAGTNNTNVMTPLRSAEAIAALGGKVLQVVQAVKTTLQTTTSTTFIDVTGMSATITPRATSSKVLCVFSGVLAAFADNESAYGEVLLLRGSTNVTTVHNYVAAQGAPFVASETGSSIFYLDNPATTGATTYKLQMSAGGTSTVAVFGKAALTLMEIAG